MSEKFSPIMVILVVVLAFAVGALWQKVQYLEGGGGSRAVKTVEPVARPAGEDLSKNLSKVSSDDHIRGSLDAEVFVVEYSDFQCPFCASFHPTMKQALDKYGDKIAWVYRHFPLDSLHPQARPAAVASECVAELGGNEAFWKYADYLFENQKTALNDLVASAASVGLNAQAVKNCIDSGKYDDKVESSYQAGLSAGVGGTPGNFLVNKNGDIVPLPGAVPFSSLEVAIDKALGS